MDAENGWDFDISTRSQFNQHGCLKGSGTTLYLARLYQLIVQWLKSGHTFVDLLLVDYRKEFNFITNLVAATNLKRMGTRKHILQLVIDFLCSWYQRVYALFPADLDSDWEEITYGAPQGTKLAALLFPVVITYVINKIDDQFKYM